MPAALSAAETAEASQAVGACGSDKVGYLVLVAVVVITIGAVSLYDGVRSHIGREEKRYCSAGSQTQTTYTEVRGAARPRFMVLPEHSHG